MWWAELPYHTLQKSTKTYVQGKHNKKPRISRIEIIWNGVNPYQLQIDWKMGQQDSYEISTNLTPTIEKLVTWCQTGILCRFQHGSKISC